MQMRPLEPDAVARVAAAMRACDRREVAAVRGALDPAAVAADACRWSRFGGVAWHGDEPVAALGAVPTWPGVYAVWMFATDDWPRVAAGTTRWGLRVLKPALLAAGGHRAECRALIDHEAAQRWLRRLGFAREAVLPDCGRARETFVQFAWRLSDHES